MLTRCRPIWAEWIVWFITVCAVLVALAVSSAQAAETQEELRAQEVSRGGGVRFW